MSKTMEVRRAVNVWAEVNALKSERIEEFGGTIVEALDHICTGI